MMKCTLKLNLILFCFVAHTCSMDPQKIKSILDLYEHHYFKAQDYYDSIAKGMHSGKNPCEENKNLAEEIEMVSHGTIGTIPVYFLEKPMVVTLDEKHYFEVPAIFRCVAREEQEIKTTFYLLIVEEIKKEFKYIRIYDEEREHEGKHVYTIDDVRYSRAIKEVYESKQEEMSQWYMDHRDVTIAFSLCKKIVQQQRMSFIVQSGKVTIGDLLLILDEEVSVKLPGVLTCEIKTGRTSTNYYYVKEGDSWHMVYDAFKVVDGKPTLVFEQYLKSST